MRYLPFVLACTLLQQVQPFLAPLGVRKQSPVLRASNADDNTDEIDADEAARIEEMRKRMEGMFSGAEAEAAPATEDAPRWCKGQDLLRQRACKQEEELWSQGSLAATTSHLGATDSVRRSGAG